VNSDPRLTLLEAWLDPVVGRERGAPVPASTDASFRRYFRVSTPAGSRIVMDAPPEHEDCRPFVKVAGLLNAAGLHAPAVLAADFEQGFLLLTDLGHQTYLDVLTDDNADALYGDAIMALIRWQAASRPGVLPPYDETLLRRELALFPDWYVERHLGVALPASRRQALSSVFDQIVAENLAQPAVYVHRDYMPRNLMVSDPNPGVLDFQDAVYGPIAYDVASLCRDAFISFDEERVLDWTIRYWEQARAAGLPVRTDFADFYRDCEWMGLQRHLKVLGIFARLLHRDGKPQYVADAPRFVNYIRAVTGRYRALTALHRLFDELHETAASAGLTF
jgi:aminoglycoside/choline kinase family phosphotransferase